MLHTSVNVGLQTQKKCTLISRCTDNIIARALINSRHTPRDRVQSAVGKTEIYIFVRWLTYFVLKETFLYCIGFKLTELTAM